MAVILNTKPGQDTPHLSGCSVAPGIDGLFDDLPFVHLLIQAAVPTPTVAAGDVY